MKFHKLRPQIGGSPKLVFLGGDKKTNPRAGVLKLANHRTQALDLRGAIESAFSRHLAAVFGNKTDIVGFHLQGDLDDLFGKAHFEIELRRDPFAKFENVSVLYVAAVLPQMGGDPGGADLFRHQRGGDRIGFGVGTLRCFAVTRLTQGGDMVDIDSKTGHGWIIPLTDLHGKTGFAR